jgi:transposase
MHSIRMRGNTSTPHRDPTDPPRRRANQRNGHGPYTNDRPPIIQSVSRETGAHRCWVGDRADRRTCHPLIAENIPVESTILYTDEWQSYHRSHTPPATVRHGVHEWARDDDGDGVRDTHCHTCEGAGAALRTYLRICRGVPKQALPLSVATYEAMVHAKRVMPDLIRRMGVGYLSVHTGYT